MGIKSRNPRFGCVRIAQQISYAFGVEIDKDVVRRVLAKYLWFPKTRTAGLESRPASRDHPLIVSMQSTDILKFYDCAQFGWLNRS